MCSCSGNCNCNSTTIPRGPQGPTGAAGIAATIAVGDVTALPSGSTPTITNSGTSSAATFNFGIPAGAPGTNGTNGINGKNSYTLTEDVFQQPSDGSTELVQVTDYSWISLNQIIFIGNVSSTSNIGGYYQVTAKTSPDLITVKKLDWTIPGVTFVPALSNVPGGSLVQSSGTIGATGATGANGSGITVIKSVTNSLPFGSPVIVVPANLNFTLTNSSDIFLANDLCPNDGDIGRITYETVVRRTANTSFANISMDIYLGMSGYPIPSPLIPQLDPYVDTITNSDNNKLDQVIWNTTSGATEYMYIKYVIDVQRITSTTANIFIDWKTRSATTSNSGCYHNTTTINDLDFDDLTKYFEFAVKGFNNSTTATLTFNKSRFYVESLRLPQP
jgi:hypothetical protein